MLAMVCVVRTGSMTRTSACIPARRTFSWAIAVSGSRSASRPAKNRIIAGLSDQNNALSMRSSLASCPAMLKNQAARLGVGVERPDRALDLAVGNLAVVARQRSARIDVDHLLGD